MSGDPVNYGYRILWREPEGPDVNFWMRDLLRRIEPTLATLPSGNLELKWNRRIGRQREEGVVELDPRRNYLIVRHQRRWQSVGPNGEERRASQSLRVLESKDMGGWHLPIASVEEEAQPDGTVSRLETRLTKISTTVSDSLFTDIFEPGDWVETETGPYRVGYGGRLEAVSPYPRFEHSERGRFPVLPAAIAGIVGTAAFLYAALRGRAQARTAGRAAIDRKLR